MINRFNSGFLKNGQDCILKLDFANNDLTDTNGAGQANTIINNGVTFANGKALFDGTSSIEIVNCAQFCTNDFYMRVRFKLDALKSANTAISAIFDSNQFLGIRYYKQIRCTCQPIDEDSYLANTASYFDIIFGVNKNNFYMQCYRDDEAIVSLVDPTAYYSIRRFFGAATRTLSSLLIGGSQYGASFNFEGEIDLVQIWNGSISMLDNTKQNAYDLTLNS